MYETSGVLYKKKKSEDGFLYTEKAKEDERRTYNSYLAFDIFIKNKTGSPNPDNLYFQTSTSIVAADENIDGLILWATPNDLRKTFWNALGEELYNKLDAGETLHLEDERGKMDLTPDFLTDLDQYDLSALMSKWQERPLLILHGEQDVTVNVEQGKKNFELAGGDKAIYTFPNGDHTFSECAVEANATIVKWLYSRT